MSGTIVPRPEKKARGIPNMRKMAEAMRLVLNLEVFLYTVTPS